jgi:hypothetical protein
LENPTTFIFRESLPIKKTGDTGQGIWEETLEKREGRE